MTSDELSYIIALFLTGLLAYLISKAQDFIVIKILLNATSILILVIMVILVLLKGLS